MKAIFDSHCDCVGWYDENNSMVYDYEIKWIGFVHKNSFFSNTTKWIGGMEKGTFVDKNGKPVAWIQGYDPQVTHQLLKPITPLQPLTPLRPLRQPRPLKRPRPLRPLRADIEWSKYSWEQFLRQL